MMKRTGWKALLVLSAVCLMCMGGVIYAFLTHQAVLTNVFTVGNVSAELTEPSWSAEDGEGIFPGEEFDKDPTVTISSGSADAVAFMEVTIPKKNVELINASGGKEAAALTELFRIGDLKTGWVELTGTGIGASSDTAVTRVYACTSVLTAGDAKTLFDTVTFANVAEGQIGSSEELKLTVTADLIQAGGMSIEDPDAITSSELIAIYGKFKGQNS